MAEENGSSWWRRTSALALSVMIGAGALGLGSLILAPALDAGAIAGIPNGLLATGLVVPLIILFLIFWSADRQNRIDQRSGSFED